ncbi:CBS domain-containing protein [Cryptosporangium sp. NPDC048952]|uniref:CBS domain-containing protein n=1 Tax=Cryptosporangium sp. NPDC048952 TaxID=3363961 RepID=UPI00372286EF
MTTRVVTVELDATAKAVAETLDRHRVSGVPVTDAAGRVVGVVTATDLLHQLIHHDGDDEGPRLLRRHRVDRDTAHGVRAADLMSAPADTIAPEASVVQAAAQLERRGVKRLPVVDAAGELVGIVSRADLVTVFTRPDRQIRDEVVGDIVGSALMLPPEQVSVDVAEGVVTLRGRLLRRSEAVLAAALTQRVDGVVRVIDELTYRDDDTHYVYA